MPPVVVRGLGAVQEAREGKQKHGGMRDVLSQKEVSGEAGRGSVPSPGGGGPPTAFRVVEEEEVPQICCFIQRTGEREGHSRGSTELKPEYTQNKVL